METDFSTNDNQVLRMKNKTLKTIFSMEGGNGDTSYAQNSQVQAYRLRSLRPILEEAIEKMTLFSEGTLRITDLGCSSGGNTLSVVDTIVNKIQTRYISASKAVPEIQVFFSDLPSNDFNSLFRLLHRHRSEDDDEVVANGSSRRAYFVTGVAGSFYSRLFPRGSLHFVHSSYSLHWLSEIPEKVLDEKCPAYNKGRVYIYKGSREVAKAYATQFQQDFTVFLRARAEEMQSGASMFLNSCGRNVAEQTQQGASGIYFGEQFEAAWDDLISEGLLDAAKRDSFNVPIYTPNAMECQEVVERQSEFRIERLQEMKLNSFGEETRDMWRKNPRLFADMLTNGCRCVIGALVEGHIGAELADQLFSRFHEHVMKAHWKDLIQRFYCETYELVITLVRN